MAIVLKKERCSLIYMLTECLMYVCGFYLFIPFAWTFFVFHGNNLVLLSLINRYVTSTSEQFLKRGCTKFENGALAIERLFIK